MVPVLAGVGPLDPQSLKPNPEEVSGGGAEELGCPRGGGCSGQASVHPLTASCPQVDEVFALPLAHLLQAQNQGYTHFCRRGHFHYTMPVFLHGPHRVWGLTAVITEFALQLLAPGTYQPRLFLPGLKNWPLVAPPFSLPDQLHSGTE